MILENRKYDLTIEIPEDWTLDQVQQGGPNLVGEWVVMLMHGDDNYRVAGVCKGELVAAYQGPNKDAAVEHYLVAVRKQVMEAMGVAYMTVEDETAPLPRRGQEREGT